MGQHRWRARARLDRSAGGCGGGRDMDSDAGSARRNDGHRSTPPHFGTDESSGATAAGTDASRRVPRRATSFSADGDAPEGPGRRQPDQAAPGQVRSPSTEAQGRAAGAGRPPRGCPTGRREDGVEGRSVGVRQGSRGAAPVYDRTSTGRSRACLRRPEVRWHEAGDTEPESDRARPRGSASCRAPSSRARSGPGRRCAERRGGRAGGASASGAAKSAVTATY